MRVVAGEYRGRKLSAVPGMATRPTTDKVKEAVFNIIGPYFDGGTSLDLYAGSGGLSIKTIKKNIVTTKHEDQFVVLKQDATRALHMLQSKGEHFDLIYLDPPYAKQQIVTDLTKMVELDLINPGAIVVAETNQEANLPEQLPGFSFKRRQDYGITVVTVYRYDGKE